jgi:uncharacterized protein YegL
LIERLNQLEHQIKFLMRAQEQGNYPGGTSEGARVTGAANLPQMTQLELAEVEFVDLYHHSPRVLASIAIKVSLTADSYRQQTQGEIYFEKAGSGNYWVVATQRGAYWLVPRDDIKINPQMMKTMQSLFNCQEYQGSETKTFSLIKPAKLSIAPDGFQWKLEEPGELDFSNTSPAFQIREELKWMKESRQQFESQFKQLVEDFLGIKNQFEQLSQTQTASTSPKVSVDTVQATTKLETQEVREETQPPQNLRKFLHLIWMFDCSGSMKVDGKIEALNRAIRQAIPLMQKTAEASPNVQLLVRAIAFSDGARWHIEQPTPIEELEWWNLEAEGVTDMGEALSLLTDTLLAEEIENLHTNEYNLPPILVMISDGYPSDDFQAGLDNLMQQLGGEKAVRIAIAVGQYTDLEVLQKFIDNPELKPLPANNPSQLMSQIKWIATTAIKSVSSSSPEGKFSLITPITDVINRDIW